MLHKTIKNDIAKNVNTCYIFKLGLSFTRPFSLIMFWIVCSIQVCISKPGFQIYLVLHFKNPGFSGFHLLQKIDAFSDLNNKKNAICVFTLFNTLRTIMKRIQLII